MTPPSMPSGWFPDPLGRHEHRYFNGTSWTSDVSDGGQRYIDPYGTSPGGPGTPGSTPLGGSPPNKAATWSIVTGSLALAISWIPFVVFIGAALVVLAIVFGVKGLRTSRETGVGRSSSIAGLVMSGLGVITVIAGVVLTIAVWRVVVDYIEPGPNTIEVTSCTIDGRRADVEGVITNLDGERRDYTVFVELGGTRRAIAVSDVPSDSTADWAVVLNVGADVTRCEPRIVVNGPFPFGVEVDPVE